MDVETMGTYTIDFTDMSLIDMKTAIGDDVCFILEELTEMRIEVAPIDMMYLVGSFDITPMEALVIYHFLLNYLFRRELSDLPLQSER